MAWRCIALVTGSLLADPLWAMPGLAGILDCVPAQPLEIAVRIGQAGSPLRLQLIGGHSPALRLLDPQTGIVHWSAAATVPATQNFPEMEAGFAGSFAAIDLDGDGLHDRVYAGDLAGRLWRLDLHHGASPESLVTGGVFAMLGGEPAMRAFVAPPDVSLSQTVAGKNWLNIAIGTVSLTGGAGINRFYVLRDHAPFDTWSRQDYQRWRPITEADLLWRDNSLAPEIPAADQDSIAGFFLILGTGAVLTPSITVSGRAVVAVAQDLDAQCGVATVVSGLSLQSGVPDPDPDGTSLDGGLTLRVSQRLPASTGLRISSDVDAAQMLCTFGPVAVPGCAVSTRPTPLWWRREDAD